MRARDVASKQPIPNRTTNNSSPSTGPKNTAATSSSPTAKNKLTTRHVELGSAGVCTAFAIILGIIGNLTTAGAFGLSALGLCIKNIF